MDISQRWRFVEFSLILVFPTSVVQTMGLVVWTSDQHVIWVLVAGLVQTKVLVVWTKVTGGRICSQHVLSEAGPV